VFKERPVQQVLMEQMEPTEILRLSEPVEIGKSAVLIPELRHRVQQVMMA
jgi:hypothetical protein